MTNEQKVRVDRLERYLITDKDKIYTRVRVGDLDTAISLIKQLESEKEIHIGLEHQYKKEYLDMLDLTKKYKRQIDLMANSILAREIGKNSCQFNETCIKFEKGRDTHCKDCIKQYFERKVEDVKN